MINDHIPALSRARRPCRASRPAAFILVVAIDQNARPTVRLRQTSAGWPVGLYARRWPLSRVPGWSVAKAVLYRSAMTTTGHLLRILGVAIVLIAAQFMSLPVRAHTGHVHGPSAHAVHQHQHHVATASQSSHVAAPAAQAMPTGELRAAPQNLQDVAVNCGTCVAGCCGNGMGCCGAALAAALPASLPPVARSLGRDPEASIPGRGSEPDGLRRPPRPFA